ncbi:MAG: hemin ABC transporter substrate-binding protein [Pseudomonadota bacterium]
MKHFLTKSNVLTALHILGIAVFTGLFAWKASAEEAQAKADTISIGGSITEIVYALGEEHRLLARDTTSSFPPEVENLPDVGYIRALSPEGVLSVGPEIVIAEDGAGPANAVEVLKAASITYVEVPGVDTPAGVIDKIRVVGTALGVEEKAADLADAVNADLDRVLATVAAQKAEKRRVLFILTTQGGRIMAGGVDTAAHAIIELAGGTNVIDNFNGYKTVTAEAITAAQPDVVLMMDRGGGHSSTNEALWSTPALMLTPAAENDAVVRIGGLLLLGFGPRTAEAIETLHKALYAPS